VPSGLYQAIRVISAVFPFKAALQAIDAAVNGSQSLGGPLLHLALLIAAFAGLARMGLRRFA
jgi:ABC-2 type transport system permease protein